MKNSRYLVKNPCLYLYLRMLDTFAALIHRAKRSKSFKKTPEHILIVNWAHRGDVIIATSIFPLIKKTYPKAKLGMLLGSWSKEILDQHPLIERIHVFDHPRINRNKIGLIRKLRIAFRQFFSLIKELKENRYDLSIDLYCYYPNSHWITWLAQIPHRIGYASGGGASFLTEGMPWLNKQQHMSLYHQELLKLIGIHSERRRFLKSFLSPIAKQTEELVKANFHLEQPYVIFHPYSGDPLKDWIKQNWMELIEAFQTLPYTIVFTGGTLEERNCIEQIIYKKSRCINLANSLCFHELQTVVSNATAVICVDTMIGHLAAAYDIPTIILFSDHSDSILWQPASELGVIVQMQEEILLIQEIMRRIKERWMICD